MTIASVQVSPCCPLCGTPSTRVHSSYLRSVADLPCGGQQVQLLLHVRKCFCEVSTCQRKIFAERITPFVDPWARVTQRLFQIVQTLGLATGGRLGVRVTERLSIQTSKTTILRRIMALPTEPVGEVTQIGIDDFAFRRGRKFGTIVVDLRTHQVLDVLPDRTADTSAAWMAAHPELDIVSRDRGGDYAAAARKAAPQATQTADRFHLYKNLTEAVELVLTGLRAEIRTNAEKTARQEVSVEVRKAHDDQVKSFSVKTWKPARDPHFERARMSRREQRHDRYEQAVFLNSQGFEQAEIAKRVGLSTRTIQKWLKAGAFPDAKPRRKRRSLFDPYALYVLQRWREGCKKGSVLYQEIKEKGYTGTERQVYRFLTSLREQLPLAQQVEAPQTPVQDFSAHEAVWLFVRHSEDLSETEQETLTAILSTRECE